jgi:hypothetical protein
MTRSRFLCLTSTATFLILVTVVCGLNPDARLPSLAADGAPPPTAISGLDDQAITSPSRLLLRSLGFLSVGVAITLLIGCATHRHRSFALMTGMLVMLGFAAGGILSWVQDGWPGWILVLSLAVSSTLGLWSAGLLFLGEPESTDPASEEDEDEDEEEPA